MSCFPESTYAIYVDGELPSEERRPVESHLIGCQSCRALVVALRDESSLLSDVLCEREVAAIRTVPRTPPARKLAAVSVPALALALGLATAAGWILESRLPTSVGWMSPLRLIGAFEMAFDLIFLVRDRVPGLLEFVVASAVMIGVAAILTFALGVLTRRWLGSAALLLAMLIPFASPDTAAALDLRFHQESLRVPAGERIDATLVVSGESVDVDGSISGDLIALADRVTIRGEVEGNVFVASRSLEIPGRVIGSLLVFSERVVLSGEVGGSVYTAAEHYTLTDTGQIARDATHGGDIITLEGRVGRDAFAFGHRFELRGSVARNVDARSDGVSLVDGARIGGDLNAEFFRAEDLEIASGAVIIGETTTQEHLHREHWMDHYKHPAFYLWVAVWLIASFVVGMCLYALVPATFGVSVEGSRSFFRAILIGFATLVAAPIAVLLMAITVVGIPLALIGLGLYLMTVYLAGIVVAALIGTAVTAPADDSLSSFGVTLIVGLLILAVASNIPILGIAVEIVVILLGIGLLIERARVAWIGSSQGHA